MATSLFQKWQWSSIMSSPNMATGTILILIYRPTTRKMPHWMAKIFGIFSGEMRTALEIWGKFSSFTQRVIYQN